MQIYLKIKQPKNRAEALRLIRAFNSDWFTLNKSNPKVKTRGLLQISRVITSIILVANEDIEKNQQEIEMLEYKKQTAEEEGRFLLDYNQKLINLSIEAANAEAVKYVFSRWAKKHRLLLRV